MSVEAKMVFSNVYVSDYFAEANKDSLKMYLKNYTDEINERKRIIYKNAIAFRIKYSDTNSYAQSMKAANEIIESMTTPEALEAMILEHEKSVV
jgi:hypothetical protein